MLNLYIYMNPSVVHMLYAVESTGQSNKNNLDDKHKVEGNLAAVIQTLPILTIQVGKKC